MDVLITDGNQRSALALVRALGKAGLEVAVGESSANSLAGSSKYCRARLRYPSPAESPERFLEFMKEETARERYRVLFPVTDLTVQLIAGAQRALPVCVPMPGPEQIRMAQDKAETLRLAQSVGMDIPVTYMLDPGQRVEDVARVVPYPCVIKPRLSRFYAGGRWRSGGIQYASGPEELIAKYRAADAEIPRPLVQERLRGEGRGVFLLVWEGRLYAAFGHRRLREKPPSGGVSVLRDSVPLDRELVEKSCALLRKMQWQGVAMVECKVDERDGRGKLMEVNGRFWGSLQLAADAGVNFPLMLYRLATGEAVEPQFEYRVGVKSRWLMGDLDSLLLRLRAQAANGDARESRWRALREFLHFFDRDTRYEIMTFDDPAPGWYEFEHWIEDLLQSRRGAAHAR